MTCLTCRIVAVVVTVLVSVAPAFGLSHQWDYVIFDEHPLTGEIWDTTGQQYVSRDEAVRRVLASDHVFVGETHDNPFHHAVQAWLLDELASRGRCPTVALEMIDRGQEPVIDWYVSRYAPDARMLGPMLDWETRGWPDWEMYRPVLAAALSGGMPIRPANLPRAAIRRIVAEGVSAIPGDVAQRLNETPLSPEANDAMRRDIISAHCNLLPAKLITGMVLAQRVRDALMSLAATESDNGGVVVLAGSEHARRDRGAPARMRAPGSSDSDSKGNNTTLSVALVEVGPGLDHPRDYTHLFGGQDLPFDLVWFTPRMARPASCVAQDVRPRPSTSPDTAPHLAGASPQ